VAILKDGFETITYTNQATEDEKALAEFGIAVATNTIKQKEGANAYRDAAKASLEVMNAIHIGGPIGNVIARSSYDAVKNLDFYDAKRSVLKDGFKAIINNPKTTPEQKAIAQCGIKSISGNISDINASMSGSALMQSLF
jgi:hypothetical protein